MLCGNCNPFAGTTLRCNGRWSCVWRERLAAYAFVSWLNYASTRYCVPSEGEASVRQVWSQARPRSSAICPCQRKSIRATDKGTYRNIHRECELCVCLCKHKINISSANNTLTAHSSVLSAPCVHPCAPNDEPAGCYRSILRAKVSVALGLAFSYQQKGTSHSTISREARSGRHNRYRYNLHN